MAENITLNNVATFQNDTTAVTTINGNNAAITTAFLDVLSRSGVSPNQMTSNLDMNSNQIINLPSPGTVNSPARLVDVVTNPTITVPPTGTSGAVVPFLNGANTWSATQTFSNPVIFNGTVNTNSTVTFSGTQAFASATTFNATTTTNAVANFTNGLVLTYSNPSVFTAGTTNSFVGLSVATDNLDGSAGNVVDGYSFYHGYGGSSTKGARQSMQVTSQLLAATSATNTNRNYVAGVFTAQAISNDGGGVGTEKGSIFSLNPVATLSSSSTNIAELAGGEVNISAATGSTTLRKYGWKITSLSTDTVSGSVQDAAIFLGNQAGAAGWGTLFQMGDGVNAAPLKTTGTVMNFKGAPTVANGIDLSNATITTSAFKSTGFNVDGSGNLTSSGNLIASGVLTVNGVVTAANATAIPAGGTTGVGYRFSSTSNFGTFFGSGAPTLSAAKGSLYLRSDATTNVTRAYINTDGATTWTAINTVA